MQSGISRLAAVLRAREVTGGPELFYARVTAALALDDGGGIVIPAGDYLTLKHAGYEPSGAADICAGMCVLAAWVDGQVIVLGSV